MRISDWSSDVCSSDLVDAVGGHAVAGQLGVDARAARLGVFVFLQHQHAAAAGDDEAVASGVVGTRGAFGRVVVVGGQRAHRVELRGRSEEHTSELQSLMRTSYAVFCLKKQKQNTQTNNQT